MGQRGPRGGSMSRTLLQAGCATPCPRSKISTQIEVALLKIFKMQTIPDDIIGYNRLFPPGRRKWLGMSQGLMVAMEHAGPSQAALRSLPRSLFCPASCVTLGKVASHPSLVKKKRVTQRLLRGGGYRVGEVLNLKHLGVCPHGSLKKRGHCYPGWGPGLS